MGMGEIENAFSMIPHLHLNFESFYLSMASGFLLAFCGLHVCMYV